MEDLHADIRIAHPKRLYIDLTTCANYTGPPTGIARTEERLAIEIEKLCPDRVNFIVWNSRLTFLPASKSMVESGEFKELAVEAGVRFMRDATNLLPEAQIDIEEGDHLIIFGGAWANPAYAASVTQLCQRRRLALTITVHDVIRWRHAHWFADGVGELSAKTCAQMLRFSDSVITNSKCSANDLRALAGKMSVPLPQVDIVRWGDAIESFNFSEEIQLDLINLFVSGKRFVLYVSSIDHRKNHTLLQRIWRQLIIEFGDDAPDLVLVGRLFWKGEQIVEQLDADALTRDRIHLLRGVNDRTLDWLYRECLFTVYPSLYEGWGLPVAESLRYGKVCVASNAGSIPEIAPAITDLLDPFDFSTWYDRICRYAFNDEARRQRSAMTKEFLPTEWAETAAHVLQIIDKVLPRSVKHVPTYRLGDLLSFGKEGTSAVPYMLGGWYSTEELGTWTAGRVAELQLKLSDQTAKALILQAKLRPFLQPGVTLNGATVFANDVQVARWEITPALATYRATIPTSVVMAGRSVDLLNLRIVIDEVHSPAEFGLSKDSRLLGAHLYSMQVD